MVKNSYRSWYHLHPYLCKRTWSDPERAFTDLCGNGLLAVQDSESTVSIVNDTWKVEELDIGREVFITGNQYVISAINMDDNTFTLDRPNSGQDDKPVRFLIGSVPYGQPWSVSVPTRLVIVSEERSKLNQQA